ncbi:MAG TPA: metalloregulator ArsR/SmtB family transcription factor [Pirellulaceae bacterium]|nr:metalloregulator ArsR/SmtB family transcription factor [Pirellulaceae bacterium]
MAVRTIATAKAPQDVYERGDSALDDRLDSESCAEKLKALGEPIRLRIVDLLRRGPQTVGEIALSLEHDLALVSHHLRILHGAALVERRKEGRFVIYRLREGILEAAKSGARSERLDLGCCRLEVPDGDGE